MSEQTFTLSNPRKEESIENWPVGSNRRATAVFTHEANKRGERIGRTTTGKIKYSTYNKAMRLVDGSDGKTHMMGWTSYGFISVMSCDMKHSDFGVFQDDENFAEYKSMLGVT